MYAHPNTTTTIMRSVSSESREYIADSTTNMLGSEASPNNPSTRPYSSGPVAILWDIENCPVPSSVRPEDVGGNIRMALRVHPVIRGAVTMFSAYGDFNSFPRRLREGCQRTGVKLVDVPGGRKDSADKAILVDMFLFALDNPPPSSVMLISGDVDFSPALHILGQRGYTVILVAPDGVGVSSALLNAGTFVWDWRSVAHGDGFVPPPVTGDRPEPGESDFWVRPGDVNGLKGQIARLLEISGGGLFLYRVPSEYRKIFGRPLYVSEYGEVKLVDLLTRMEDVVAVEGKGKRRFVYVRKWKTAEPGVPAPPVILLRRNGDGKGNTGVATSAIGGVSMNDRCVRAVDPMLEQFKRELQEILVSYSCQISVGSFEELYQQRYKKPVDHRKYGVDRLEDLFEKLGGIVGLHEEPGSQNRFLSVLGG